jgi:hypothetical protein
MVDGIMFDSKAEASRYSLLRILLDQGKISDLELQVPFVIEVNGLKICKYIADFVYTINGQRVVEDVKGVRTPEYKLKRKLMSAVFGIEIQEIGSENPKWKKSKSSARAALRSTRNRKK